MSALRPLGPGHPRVDRIGQYHSSRADHLAEQLQLGGLFSAGQNGNGATCSALSPAHTPWPLRSPLP